MLLRLLLSILVFAVAWQLSPFHEVVPVKRKPGAGYDHPAEAARFFVEQRAWPDGIPEQWHSRSMAHVARMEREGFTKSSRGWSWISLGPVNVAGRIRAMAIDPSNASIIYAGSAGGGVWKSETSGRNWRKLDDLLPNLRIGAVAVNPFDHAHVLAGCGEGYVAWQGGAAWGRGIYVSTDAGTHWAMLPSTDRSDFSYVFDVTFDVHVRDVILASTASGVFRSSDGGASWTRVLSRPVAFFSAMVVVSNTQPGVMYAGVEANGVFRSTDHGQTWSGPLNNGIPLQSFSRVVLAAAPSDGRIVYAAFTGVDEQCAGVYRSDDGGDSWRSLSIPRGDVSGQTYMGGQGRYNSVLSVHPINPDIVWAGGIDMYRSDDGGRFWKQMSNWYRHPRYTYVHADIHAIIFDPANPEIILAATDGGLFRSRDGGRNFEELSAGMVTVQFHSGTPHPYSDMVIGGTMDNGTLRTLDGTSWYDVTGGDGGYTAIDPDEPRIVYSELYYLHFLKSTDWGRTFYPSMAGIPRARDFGTSDPVAFIAPFELAPWNSKTLFAGSNRVFRSTNAAETWVPISGNLAGDGYITALGLAASDPNVIYTGASRGHVHRTTDGGLTWRRIDAGLPGRWVTDFAVHRSDPDWVFVALSGFGGGHVYVSTDGGKQWRDISGSGQSALPDVPVNRIFQHPLYEDVLYAGTDVGLFHSTDLGDTWVIDNNGIGNVIIADVRMRRDGVLFVATHGRGMYRSSMSIIDGASTRPLSAVLGQSYPNPVSVRTGGEAVVPYTLIEPSRVRLELRDVTGRLARTHHFGMQEKGDYSYPLNIDGLAAGVYMYRLYIDGRAVDERRMMLVN